MFAILEAMLEARCLGKRFSDRWLFRYLEFELKRGECLVVYGPNGSGKSTLLRILATLEPPTEGEIHRPSDDVRTSIGFLSPDLALYPNLTGRELLDLVADLRGVPRPSSDAGLGEAIHQKTSTYSTGMRARLKLAVATMCKPEVLILDEPGLGLDEEGKMRVEEVITQQRQHRCIVLATNDTSERRFGELELRLG